MYQTFKFFAVRVGISLFMLLTFGFFGLYFLHEIALPGVHLDDEALHWLFGGIFVFFGFIGYGMWGEYRFEKTLRCLRDLDPQKNEEIIIRRYENLIDFTRSSHFLPGKARRLRNEAISDYADYLHSIGKDNLAALKIYLKAYLLEPTTSRFRLPLLSALKRVKILGLAEIDLLLVMFRSAKRPDHAIASHLADLMIKQNRFSRKTEPIFLTAIQASTENVHAIISFVLPRLLKKNRFDEFAMKFYLSSLGFHPVEEGRLKTILATAYCEGHWRAIDPSLHEKCRAVLEGLSEAEQERARQSVRETDISEKWKRLKLFEMEDLRGLRDLQIRFGVVQTKVEVLRKGIDRAFQMLKNLFRRSVLATLEGLIDFSRMSLKVKFVLLVGLVMFISGAIGYLISQGALVVPSNDLAAMKSLRRVLPKAISKIDRDYTLQVAAVTSEEQADRIVWKLKRRGLRGVYSIKSKRRTGGYWFKIRVGQFDSKLNAQTHAHQLIREKAIKNYFIIAYARQSP